MKYLLVPAVKGLTRFYQFQIAAYVCLFELLWTLSFRKTWAAYRQMTIPPTDADLWFLIFISGTFVNITAFFILVRFRS